MQGISFMAGKYSLDFDMMTWAILSLKVTERYEDNKDDDDENIRRPFGTKIFLMWDEDKKKFSISVSFMQSYTHKDVWMHSTDSVGSDKDAKIVWDYEQRLMRISQQEFIKSLSKTALKHYLRLV